MTMNFLGRTVGNLVAERPLRAVVFEKYRIDYCCGGNRSLEDACRERALSPVEVVAELEAADRERPAEDRDWSEATCAELCDHIVSRHHGYLRAALPRVGALVDKVASVHGERNPKLLRLRDVYQGFRTELESHMLKEEQTLFPLCRRLDGADVPVEPAGTSVCHPIRAMIEEHDDAGAALREMYALTDAYAPPAGACNSYRALLAGLADLEQDMHRHVHLENSVLFPRAMAAELRATGGNGPLGSDERTDGIRRLP